MTDNEQAIVKAYMSRLGKIGGPKGKGKKKEQLAEASRIRWDRYRQKKAAMAGEGSE
jgi:hypothetical protein